MSELGDVTFGVVVLGGDDPQRPHREVHMWAGRGGMGHRGKCGVLTMRTEEAGALVAALGEWNRRGGGQAMTREFCDFCGAEVYLNRGERLGAVTVPEGGRGRHSVTVGLCWRCQEGVGAILRHEPTDWPGAQ